MGDLQAPLIRISSEHKMGPFPHIEHRVSPELNPHSKVAGLSHVLGHLLQTETRAHAGDTGLNMAGQRLYAPGYVPGAAPLASVLQISDDLTLGESREMILRLAGCFTITVPARAIAEDRDLKPFDVALLCQSVCTRDALSIAASLRVAAPHIMILRIVLLAEEAQGRFDAVLPAPVLPSVLQSQVCRLAQQARVRAAILSSHRAA